MKKFIRNCMYILAIIILLSFILPSFSAKADTVTVSGKVTDKNSNVKGIKVILCDSNGNPYDDGKYNAETKEDGEYKISVPEGMGDYKLKFEYSGYKSAKAEQIGVKDYKQEQDVCEQLQVRYVIPRKEKDTFKNGKIARELNKCGNKSEYLEYPLEDYWITYDGNNKYNENDELENSDSDSNLNLIDMAKNIKTKYNTGLEPKIARIAIIIKATNNMPGINGIKDNLKENVTDNGKYRYFVLDKENIFNDVKTEIEKEKEKKRTTICNNEDELIEKVCNYIGFVITSTDIEIGNSNEDNLITNTISNGESTKVNLTLGDKKEETQTKPNEPNPSPEPDVPESPTPAPTPTPDPQEQHNETGDDIRKLETNNSIKGTIYVDGVKLKQDNLAVYLELSKRYQYYDEDAKKWITKIAYGDKGYSDNENFSMNYIPTSSGKDQPATNNGTYILKANFGGHKNTAIKDYNGQNYEIEKILINGNNNSCSETNRDNINNYFSIIGNEKAKLVNKKLDKEKLANNTALIVNSEFEVSGADGLVPKEYDIEIHFKKRHEFKLEVTQKISAAQMILSNGQILKSYKEEDGTSSGMIGDKIVWDVDDELKHGATVQIEYEITVTNNSDSGDINCNEFTLIDYLDYNNTSLQYRSDANLITENKKNSDYKWTTVTDFNALQTATKTTLDEGKTYLQLIDSIGGGQTKTYKLVASMVITSELAIDNYQNAVEIISYKNADGRVDRSAIPGTYNPNLGATNDNEHDSAKAQEVSIIPPTGTKQKWYTQLLETILNMFI